ncbi:hypothetical protein A2442_01900 [Candidatus Campbellbacteria bacterium RIFOXYC2_FULL_35_25]|uniref:DNA polymerase III delta subunit-like C-terminal domain-containing protein n=1 Tax=Candidatus Campbellbacteria bacterium RIFOXYC2_FULL_35_25 TaxID=1797582 RepID=A0A1F5EIH1_9BACT|nr:MAG: hypothetical protein A2442_01900 [Candidatus Campbellbacteria bacterium RIFOXYC2_FULL_35_25]
MLYLLYGSDFKKSREKLHSMIDSLLKKKPEASFFKMESSGFSETQLDELISSQGLFEKKYIVQVDGLFEDKKSKETVLDKLEEISKSENIFFFIEEKIDKPTLKRIEKVAQKVQEFRVQESEGRKFGVVGGGELNLGEFNIFNLADAFGNKDKKNLWVLYQKAKRHNIPAEEMHGILMWQVKSILTAQNSKSVDESGLKPFVYNKSIRFAKNFKEGEVEELSSKLISIYHDARRGIIDFDTVMERFILGV